MIPAAAVEAAAKAHFERDGGRWDEWTPEEKAEELEDMRAALEAAAPHIVTAAKAEALEDAAEWLKQPTEPRGGVAYWWLHEKADAYRKGRLK